jgi:hypothetical protein
MTSNVKTDIQDFPIDFPPVLISPSKAGSKTKIILAYVRMKCIIEVQKAENGVGLAYMNLACGGVLVRRSHLHRVGEV